MTFFNSIIAQHIMAFHDAANHGASPAHPISNNEPHEITVWQWIANNHKNNADLWAEEDLARRTTVSSDDIATNKRRIDGFNQARNDATERVDEEILIQLAQRQINTTTARLHSETAGAMIDRMSIMSLKIKAMTAQTMRTDVDDAHINTCKAKLAALIEQRHDLGACLDELLADAQAGRAYYKVYRQFKMYNDKTLNPELVKETVKTR
jgi:hypothetical protein